MLCGRSPAEILRDGGKETVRNVDKIRVLENQLEHERNQVARLREENTTLHTANTQIRQMTDAVITEM